MTEDAKRERSIIIPRVIKLTGFSFVPAMSSLNMNAKIPRLFRTYRAPKHISPNCTIWEAVRATCASPTFFKHMVIDGESYVDGGMGCNNPVQQVLQEAELVFPDRHVACIISIGAGQARTISIPKPGWFQRVLPLKVVEAIRKIATDCEESAQVVARRFERTPGIYFRFNVEQGLQEIGLEQWERLDEVRAHTGQYIRMADVDSRLDAAVTSIYGRQRVIPTAYTSADIKSMLIMPWLNFCVKVVRSHFHPAGGQTSEAARLRPMSLLEDKTFSQKCESIFLVIWGSNMSLSCTGWVVPGRAKLRSNLLTHARWKLRILGIPHSLYK